MRITHISYFCQVYNSQNFLPDNLDVLFRFLKAKSKRSRRIVEIAAHGLLDSFQLMNNDEKYLIFQIFMNSCPHDLEDNVHIELDLLRRITKWLARRIVSTLRKFRSVNFYVDLPDQKDTDPESSKIIYVRFSFWNASLDELADIEESNFTEIAVAMINIVRAEYCDAHALELLTNLNFFRLSREFDKANA